MGLKYHCISNIIVHGALGLASLITEFADYQGCEELSSAVAKVTNIYS